MAMRVALLDHAYETGAVGPRTRARLQDTAVRAQAHEAFDLSSLGTGRPTLI